LLLVITEETMAEIAEQLAVEGERGTIEPADRASFASSLRQFCLAARLVFGLGPSEPSGIATASAMQIGKVYARLGLSAESLFQTFRRLRELIEDETAGTSGVEDEKRLYRATERLLESAVVAYIHQQTHTLTDRAKRDPLTWLLNRSAFDLCLRDEVERAKRYSRDLSLVLLDIDRFKSVNDLLGHPAGDEVLLAVAGTLRSSLRHSDLAFRYGGDEFAAICPETPGNVIHGLLERLESKLRQRFAEANLREEVGISWGVSSFPVDAGDVAGMMQIADQRLYACKQTHHRQHA
jgi:diguanylate cyclase (GGDEF)-like protein